jgi:glycosyltransferase involved in cell wall biosynthesis
VKEITRIHAHRRLRKPVWRKRHPSFQGHILELAISQVVPKLVRRIVGSNVLLGWHCFRARKRYDVIVTDGEQVGIPYAGFSHLARRTRPTHAMVVHVLSVTKKVIVWRTLRLVRRMDLLFVYCSRQREFAVERLGCDASRVALTTFMVDTHFFAPAAVEPGRRARPMICSAGLEFRDYATLLEAVRGLDVDVVIAAASPWSKRRDSSAAQNVPDNVEICRLGFKDLRQLYADAAFVVMPLVDVEFQAGITTILEAMAMGKAVVCTRTRGQTDTIVDDVTGVYVPPGDASRLRAAIHELLDDPARATRLGQEARRWVTEHADVEVYAARVSRLVGALDHEVGRRS